MLKNIKKVYFTLLSLLIITTLSGYAMAPKSAQYHPIDRCGLLHMAVKSDAYNVVNSLLDLGYNVNTCDDKGKFPLFYCRQQHAPITDLLVKHGANPLTKDNNGISYLEYMLSRTKKTNKSSTLTTFLKKFSTFITPEIYGQWALSAVLHNYPAILQGLLDYKQREPFTIPKATQKSEFLLILIYPKNRKQLSQLLEMGMNPNTKNEHAITLLHAAVETNQINLVNLLCSYKADTTIYNQNGWAPLHTTADYGASEITQELLNNGADVNIRSTNQEWPNWTPLHKAASLAELEVATVLLNHGALVDAENDLGQTPLYIAIHAGHHTIAQLLLHRGARYSLALLKEHIFNQHQAQLNGQDINISETISPQLLSILQEYAIPRISLSISLHNDRELKCHICYEDYQAPTTVELSHDTHTSEHIQESGTSHVNSESSTQEHTQEFHESHEVSESSTEEPSSYFILTGPCCTNLICSNCIKSYYIDLEGYNFEAPDERFDRCPACQTPDTPILNS